MSTSLGGDQQDHGERRIRARRVQDAGGIAPEGAGGGMTARWQARLRLQEERRTGERRRATENREASDTRAVS